MADEEVKKYRRIYAIPDIHGMLNLLDKALEKLDELGLDESKDAVIFLGDMIDRGPDSCGVIDLIKLLCTQKPHCYKAIAGNHEDFMIDTLIKCRPHSEDNWNYNGGIQTMESYQRALYNSVPNSHLEWIGKLPIYLELQGFFFSHAPVPTESMRIGYSRTHRSLPGDKYSRHDLTWTYFEPHEDNSKGGRMYSHKGPLSDCGQGKGHLIGVCGHIFRFGDDTDQKVRIFKNYRMLDCAAGCIPGAPLAIHECISCTTHYVV